MAKRNIITLALAALFVVALAVGASAGIPDTNNSTASAANCGRYTVAPGGGSTTLGDDGYTVTVTVLDINGDAVVGLPATDMYLWHDDLATCPGTFSEADGPTDGTGTTTFSGTIYAGVAGDAGQGIDCDTAFLYVYALGIILNQANPVCVATDSPDLNGDLSVGVTDFAKFAADFNCLAQAIPCDPCHDYDESGDTNVTDFAVFGSYFNDSVCP